MEVRELLGMAYRSFEVTADAAVPTHKVLRHIAGHVKEYPRGWQLHSITMACDPYSETDFIYTVVLSR